MDVVVQMQNLESYWILGIVHQEHPFSEAYLGRGAELARNVTVSTGRKCLLTPQMSRIVTIGPLPR